MTLVFVCVLMTPLPVCIITSLSLNLMKLPYKACDVSLKRNTSIQCLCTAHLLHQHILVIHLHYLTSIMIKHINNRCSDYRVTLTVNALTMQRSSKYCQNLISRYLVVVTEWHPMRPMAFTTPHCTPLCWGSNASWWKYLCHYVHFQSNTITAVEVYVHRHSPQKRVDVMTRTTFMAIFIKPK